MYFRRLTRATTWQLSNAQGLDVVALETDKGIEAEGRSFSDIASLIKFFGPGTCCKFIGSAKNPDNLVQLDTGDGETYKIRKQPEGGWKLWGKSIRVTIFPTWADLFSNFDQVFFKRIESFDNPEYVCTDSKGRYVATVTSSEAGWTVLSETAPPQTTQDLNKAMEIVLMSL